MTLPLVLLAVLLAGLVGLVAWRLARLPGLISRQAQPLSLGAKGVGLTLADQPADMPWVPALTTATATRATQVGDPPPDTRTAVDWYDPTAEAVPQTFNEHGFITSPSPAPVNPKTGTVPLTNADVCAWLGHQVGSPCPRCGL